MGKIKITSENTQTLKSNEVFVFGSNLAGQHLGGAALLAKEKFGAELGVGEGMTGQCYALPTKDENIETLPIAEIHKVIEQLRETVGNNRDKFFIITAVGCGLAGYEAKDIAPMFENFINFENISLPQSFVDVIFPKVIKGYKVTDSEMKCRGFEYSLNKEYTHKGKVVICKSGFHFCKKLEDCFTYYDFKHTNRVFEVEGYGDYDFNDDKVTVEKIKFIRELNWFEVLSLVNKGQGNSGLGNSGNYNSGDYNSGHRNSGDRNSGNYNSGDYNSGHRNSGDRNSGHYNSGDRNSGNRNSGYCNSGHRNSGDRNSGHYNSGDRNSGVFNTNEPNARLFNKEYDKKLSELNIPYIYLPLNEWVSESEMTAEEKENNPKFYVLKGYLKKLSYEEAWKVAWENLQKDEKEKFTSLPNFDKDIFFEITGVQL